jgi:hypothetical protein
MFEESISLSHYGYILLGEELLHARAQGGERW